MNNFIYERVYLYFKFHHIPNTQVSKLLTFRNKNISIVMRTIFIQIEFTFSLSKASKLILNLIKKL